MQIFLRLVIEDGYLLDIRLIPAIGLLVVFRDETLLVYATGFIK